MPLSKASDTAYTQCFPTRLNALTTLKKKLFVLFKNLVDLNDKYLTCIEMAGT